MPLGKLSKTQLAKGFEVLEELEQAVDSKNRKKMMDLSSRFYTVIPHDFGRKIPPVIDTLEIIRQKYDMLLVGSHPLDELFKDNAICSQVNITVAGLYIDCYVFCC